MESGLMPRRKWRDNCTQIIRIAYTVLSVLVGLYLSVQSIWFSPEPFWVAGLLFLLCPAVNLLVLVLEARRHLSLEHGDTVLGTTLLCNFLLAAGLLLYMFVSTGEYSNTDIGSYKRMFRITPFPDHTIERLYPDEIPDDAKNPQFMFRSGNIIGFTTFWLQFQTNETQLHAYQAEFAQAAVWQGTPDQCENGTDAQQSALSHLVAENENFWRDKTTTVYLFYAHDSDTHSDAPAFNHGALYAAAVSESTRTVAFYVSCW
ncbi:MAG: hypothetical protein QM689_06685 [Oscillospiraceae bacterium]